jgi:hypothetical protein
MKYNCNAGRTAYLCCSGSLRSSAIIRTTIPGAEFQNQYRRKSCKADQSSLRLHVPVGQIHLRDSTRSCRTYYWPRPRVKGRSADTVAVVRLVIRGKGGNNGGDPDSQEDRRGPPGIAPHRCSRIILPNN